MINRHKCQFRTRRCPPCLSFCGRSGISVQCLLSGRKAGSLCWALDLSDFHSYSKMHCAFYFWIHTGKPIKLKGYSFHYICLQAAQIEMQTTSIE